MGKLHAAGVSPELAEWIRRQHVFFVATAPLAGGGLVNCSPKGMDSLRVLGPHEVAYADLTGSGVETIAHLRENGRLVIMFCAFDGAPRQDDVAPFIADDGADGHLRIEVEDESATGANQPGGLPGLQQPRLQRAAAHRAEAVDVFVVRVLQTL